jgi:hypothetical protein
MATMNNPTTNALFVPTSERRSLPLTQHRRTVSPGCTADGPVSQGTCFLPLAGRRQKGVVSAAARIICRVAASCKSGDFRRVERMPRPTETFGKGAIYEVAQATPGVQIHTQYKDLSPTSQTRRGLSSKTRAVLCECVGAVALGILIAIAAAWGIVNDPAFDTRREPAKPSNMGKAWVPEQQER